MGEDDGNIAVVIHENDRLRSASVSDGRGTGVLLATFLPFLPSYVGPASRVLEDVSHRTAGQTLFGASLSDAPTEGRVRTGNRAPSPPVLPPHRRVGCRGLAPRRLSPRLRGPAPRPRAPCVRRW